MATPMPVFQRLDEVRGLAPRRSPTVRVLAAFAQNADCRLAALGLVAGVDFDQTLRGTRFQPTFGQSPFAFARGLTFERMLRENGHARTIDLLREPLALPESGVRVVNLRQDGKGSADRMGIRADRTVELLRAIIRRDPGAPHLLDGAVLRGTVGGLNAYFEVDTLAARSTDGQLRVVEVKSFPKVDDRVDPEQLGSALDQAALYVMHTADLLAGFGVNAAPFVSDTAMLITPRNVGLMPVLSQQRVTGRVARMRRVLAAVPNAADLLAATPADISFGRVADVTIEENRRVDALHALADRVGTAYSPACLATCGHARFCRARAVGAESPCVSGNATARLLPEIITLGRAASLSHGAEATPAEMPAATLLERAGRLIDEATGAGVPLTARNG